MSLGWTVFIAVLVIGNVAACAWLIMWSSKQGSTEGATTGHTWDGDVVEGNNPLPRWWLGLFWLTIAFGIVYVIAYPSFGDFSLLGWSEVKQYDQEIERAEETYGKVFAQFAAVPIAELSKNPAALSAGHNLFVNNCAPCHGSDARGARDYPNLTDDEWLYGGSPEQILTTIQNGRTGVMPPFGAALNDEQRGLLADYVLSLSGRGDDQARIDEGKKLFMTYCIACHGPTGQGNQLLGAANLTNQIWLHGSGRSAILDVITNGRTNTMPPQLPVLGADRVHVLAAYIYSLSKHD